MLLCRVKFYFGNLFVLKIRTYWICNCFRNTFVYQCILTLLCSQIRNTASALARANRNLLLQYTKLCGYLLSKNPQISKIVLFLSAKVMHLCEYTNGQWTVLWHISYMTLGKFCRISDHLKYILAISTCFYV